MKKKEGDLKEGIEGKLDEEKRGRGKAGKNEAVRERKEEGEMEKGKKGKV